MLFDGILLKLISKAKVNKDCEPINFDDVMTKIFGKDMPRDYTGGFGGFQTKKSDDKEKSTK